QVQPAPGVARLDRRARSPARLLLLSDELPAVRAPDARAPRLRAGLGDSGRSLRRAHQPRAPPGLVRREDHADPIAACRVPRRGQAVARARALLLSLLALDSLRRPSEVPDHAAAVRRKPDRTHLEPRRRL